MRFCFCKYELICFGIFVTFLLSGCATGYDASVECYSTSQFRKYTLPSFTSYLMNVKVLEESRIDVYLQMQYRNLRFEKIEDGYKASYSLAYIIRNTDKEVVQTKELERSIIAKTYEETISSRFDGVLQTFVLRPSKYTIEIISNDHLSQLHYRQNTRFDAKRFSDSIVTVSSILLLDTIVTDGKGISLRPVFPSSLSAMKSYYGIFQELYNVQENDSIKISESFSTLKNREVASTSISYLMPPYRLTAEECGDMFDSIYFKIDSTFVVKKNGAQQVIQFFPLPSEGNNKVTREIIVSRNLKKDTIRYSNNYFLRDRRFTNSLSLDEVTTAMRYILREEDYDSIAHVDGQERIKRINRFWESRGGLVRRKEYEQRIIEANALFTECSNGAETPMGIVYIICGTPDYVECTGGILETWFYNLGERSYSIPFRREKENIAYYSLQPFSVNDSLWQYYIDLWRRKK